MKAACERLLHPSVEEPEERARQLRLLQVLLAAPVLAAVTTAQLAIPQVGPMAAFTAVSMAFGLGLLLPFALIATAWRRLVEPAALVFGTATAALLVAAGGGLASPLLMTAAALAVEAGWVGRTRRAIGWGLVAAATAVGLGAGLTGALLPAVEPSAWQWIVPLIYGVTVAARLPLAPPERREPAVTRHTPNFEDIVGGLVLRLQGAGDVSHASRKAETLLGVAPEMLLGTGLFDRIHVADRIAWLSALTDLREGPGARTVRLRIRVPAEPGMPTEAAYRAFVCDMVAEQGAAEIFGLLRDDTATAELEQALAEARNMAESALLTRDQMLASVSHELRTPLNAIVGFSDVLANGMFGGFAHEKQREYVEIIRQAGGHLLSVVNAVLDVSKVESGSYGLQTEPIRFEEAVRLCMAMTAHQAEAKSLNLTAEIDEEVGTVHCDRRALQQVLINLLSNAVKFTPSGDVKVTAHRSGDWLDFTVSDTGIGISAEDLKRLGKPFTQVQNDYTKQCEGTGLGLALVKGLVRLQGGGMSIESAPGVGTRVHISLPTGGEGRREEDEEGAVRSGANWNGEWKHDALRKTA